MTLYLKYRSQTIEDLDLSVVRDKLKKIITSDNIPHAFLFAGPKGTGKTSAARILAKVINCEKRKKGEIEPCNECKECIAITKGESLDVVEMDAASNRGIDDIRTLRDAVKLSPISAKKKVYIIDEAHMLTTEASNALLKTLEEPPSHVVFILATTNPEKLIETIRSRTTLIQFRKGTTEEIIRSLERIAKGEKIDLSKETAEVISVTAKGSFRDAHKLLDQLLSENQNLTVENVGKILQGSAVTDPEQFINILFKKDVKSALNTVEELVTSGIDLSYFVENLLVKLRSALLAKSGIGEDPLRNISQKDLINIIRLISSSAAEMKDALIEELPLEIAIVEWCGYEIDSGNVPENNNPKNQSSDTRLNPEKPSESLNGTAVKNDFTTGQEDTSLNTDQVISPGSTNLMSNDTWIKLLSLVRPKNASTEALLRAAKPLEFDGKTLIIGVFYSFHKEKLEGNPHRMLLEETISVLTGKNIRINCQLTTPDIPVVKEDEVILTESKDNDIINVAKEIFES